MGEARNSEISDSGARLLILSVAAVLAYGYLLRIDLPFFQVRLELHQQILAGAAALGFRRAPRMVRRLAVIVPLYLATVIVWGVWSEVRLLMLLYPILVPMALSYFFAPGTDTPAHT